MTIICLLLFYSIWSQKKEITISAFSINEAEIVVKIKNNTSKNKYLFLDVSNVGVLYKDKMQIQNINSSKMYLSFFELSEKDCFIAVSTFNNFNCQGMEIEDFEGEIKKNSVLFLPNQERKFVINVYNQSESYYLKMYKILPAKFYNVSIKILGEQIKKRIENSNIKRESIQSIFSKYDFNNYQSNIFKLKIKAVKAPPPPPPPPTKELSKYTGKELLRMK